MYKLGFIFFIFTFSTIYCQDIPKQYNSYVFQLEGDLNGDLLKDSVVVKENLQDKFNPYILQIKFQQKDGSFKNALTSTKAVMEKFPYGDARTETILEELKIEKGILIFRNQQIRGSMTHKFRFQNGNFELIGFSSSNASPGYIEYVDYNLSTGTKIVRHNAYETDKVLLNKKMKEKPLKLPKLQDFEPFEFVY